MCLCNILEKKKNKEWKFVTYISIISLSQHFSFLFDSIISFPN